MKERDKGTGTFYQTSLGETLAVETHPEEKDSGEIEAAMRIKTWRAPLCL